MTVASMLRWTAAVALIAAGVATAATAVNESRASIEFGLRRTLATDPGSTVTVRSLAEDLGPLPADGTAVRWRGYWYHERDGWIEIHTTTNGILQVEVDGKTVASRTRQQGNDNLPDRLRLERGLHRITIDARLPWDGEISLQVSTPDGVPSDIDPRHLLTRSYRPKKLQELDGLLRLMRVSRALWLIAASLIGALVLRHYGPRAWIALRNPLVGSLLPALAAVAYVLLLYVWFHDPGIPGTNRLRAWPAWAALAFFGTAVVAAANGYRSALAAAVRRGRRLLTSNRAETLALLLVVLVGAAFRLPGVLWPVGVMDADAAVGALAAQHIADGRVAPAFFYGSLKTGTLSSHLAALRIAVLGPATFAMMEVTSLVYLALLVATFRLGAVSFGLFAATSAGLWLAAPPLQLTIHTTYAEYPELLLFASVSFLLASSILTGALRSRWSWFLLGVALGLGCWSHPLFVPAGLAVIVSMWRFADRRTLRRNGPAAAAGFLTGAMPAIVALGSDARGLVDFLITGSATAAASPGDSILLSVREVFTVSLPVLFFGYEHPNDPTPVAIAAAAGLLVLAIGWAAVAVRSGGARTSREPPAPRSVVAFLLATYVLVHLATFWFSPFRSLTFPPRYLLPLLLPLILLVSAALTDAPRRLGPRARTATAAVALASVILPGALSSVRWLTEASILDRAIRTSVRQLEADGIDHCEGPYWDAFRVSHASLESVLCNATDLRRIPFYGRMLRQRRRAELVPLVTGPANREIAERHRERLAEAGIAYRILQTDYFTAVIPTSLP